MSSCFWFIFGSIKFKQPFDDLRQAFKPKARITHNWYRGITGLSLNQKINTYTIAT